MSRPLFRPQAVEFRAKARTSGRVLAWRDVVAARTFVALLLALGLSVAATFAIRVDESTTGTAATSIDGDVVLLLPIGAGHRLAVGQRVRIGDATTHIARVETPRTENGVTYAVARAAVPTDPAAIPGTATVVLDNRPLAVSLVPALER